MLKTRTMLIVTCQPGISLLCSSSSYKIINVKNIIFQIGILCRKQKKIWIILSERNCLIFRISPKLPDYVRVLVTRSRYSMERHYIPNWNFMLKPRTMLIVTCQPGISILCSSSSYKIINVKNIIFQIEILCRRQKIVIFLSERNCLIFRIIEGNCLI